MEFEMPDADALRGMDREALNELREKASAALRQAYSDATAEGRTPTDDELADLEALDQNLDTIDAAIEEVKSDEEARAERAEALRARRLAEDQADDQADDEGDDEGDDETPADNDDKGADAKDDAKDEERELVTASGRRRTGGSFAALGGRRDETPDETPAEIGFRLAPGVPGRKGEGLATFADMAQAFDAMQSGQLVRSMQQVSTGTASHAATIGYLDRNMPEHLIGKDPESITAAIEAATDEHSLEGNSLVAAGGWCAPSETVYDYLDVPVASGLFSLPEISISRGGLRWPRQPDFGLGMQEQGFLYTEAEAIAQVDDKPCFEIDCGEFDEMRLDAIGLCVTAGLLQQKGYPERIAVYMQGLMKMHLHRQSSYKINKVIAGSDAVDMTGAPVMGAFGAVLNAAELAATDIRTRDRLPENATIEVIMPRWVKGAIRSDLAYRRGETIATPATDALIASAFAARGVAPQYVSDWQVGAAGQPGAATPTTTWPTEVQFLAYPAGTWFASVENVIEVGNLYDQAQLKQNRFTALFTEDGVGVGKRGTTSRIYTVPVQVNGYVGAAHDLTPAADAGV